MRDNWLVDIGAAAGGRESAFDHAWNMCGTEWVEILPVSGSSSLSGVYSSVCWDDEGCCMLAATGLGLAAVGEGCRVCNFAV